MRVGRVPNQQRSISLASRLVSDCIGDQVLANSLPGYVLAILQAVFLELYVMAR